MVREKQRLKEKREQLANIRHKVPSKGRKGLRTKDVNNFWFIPTPTPRHTTDVNILLDSKNTLVTKCSRLRFLP